MPSELYSGTASISGQTSLTGYPGTPSGPADLSQGAGIVQAFITLDSLLMGDEFLIRFYDKLNATAGMRLVEEWVVTYGHAQFAPVWVSPAFIVVHAWDFTANRISVNARNMTWSIRKV